MNLATVIVLTRPSMISPVNTLLSAVAVCDILVMTSNLIFVVHFQFVAENRCSPSDFSYGWAVFTIFHAHVSVIFHATSIWLTVGQYCICFKIDFEFSGVFGSNSCAHHSTRYCWTDKPHNGTI